MNILKAICYCAFAASIISLPFFLVNWVKYVKAQPVNRLIAVRSGFPARSTGFFVISIVTALLAATIMTTFARREALRFIKSLSGNYTVYVNTQPVGDPGKIVSALSEITPYWQHHSHPTKRIQVYIQSDERNLSLELGRDSDTPQEYWVFIPEQSGSSNEIGRITTSAFDAY